MKEKRENKAAVGSMKEKRENNATGGSRLQLATLGLLAVAIVLLAYIVFLSPPQQPQVQPTPTPSGTPKACPSPGATATHTVQDAKDYVARIMAMYRDFIHSDVPVPQYDACDQTWNAQITELVNGGTQLYHIKFADAPVFTLLSVSQEVVKPMLIGQDMLVTNGTILLNGKLNCSTNASTVRMMVFSDPYCPSCILGDEMIEAFRKNFSASLDYDYHILPASGGMQTMANSYGLTEVNRFALYDICTQKQGLLAPFKDCATLKYRSKGVAAPLSKEELDACLPEALNSTAFDACLPDAPHDLAFDQTMADTYGVTQAPVVLFNCQYRVLPEDLEHGFCYVHPEASGCS